MEGKRLIFDIRLGPNDCTNRVPRRFPTADLRGLIEDIRQNKFLDSVTIPRQWNNQDNLNTWGTHQGKTQGGVCKQMVFFQATSKGQQVQTLIQHKQERKCKIHQGRDGRHKTQNTAIQCSSNLWQIFCKEYSTPYFAKVLVAGNKTIKYLPKYGGNLHGNRDMCMHHILEKCRNQNCQFYHVQAK